MRVTSTLFFLVLVLYACSEHDAGVTRPVRPNIIWLVAEDQSPEFFPMYGDSTIQMPALEALAAEAIIYDNAYAPVPVCAPARSSIITGMYPTTLGTHNMRTYNAYNAVNETSIGIPSYSPIPPQGVKMFTEYLRKAGYYCTNNSKEDYNFKAPDFAWDESSKDAHWRKRPDGAAFFSVFNFNVTHESQIWNRANDSLFVDPSVVKIPPYFPNHAAVRKDLAVNYSNLIRLDRQIAEVISQLKEDGLYENSIIFFYSDHGGPFPRHKRAVYETGIKVPMMVKLPKSSREVREDRFVSFIDLAPTVLSLAGIEPPAVMQGKAFLGPYSQADDRDFIFATSDRFDEVYDRVRAVRSKGFKYIRNFYPEKSHALPVSYREQMPLMQTLNQFKEEGKLNADQQKWLLTPRAPEELYELASDPYELHNLAELPKYRDTLLALRARLDRWMQDTDDLGRFPEKELISGWLIDGGAPRLETPELEIQEDSIFLKAPISDATLLFRVAGDSIWQFYKDHLPVSLSFDAKAVRLGYKDSQLIHYESD